MHSDEEHDVDGFGEVTEEELYKLKRKYRINQVESHAYRKQATDELRRESQEIQQLEQEQKEIMALLEKTETQRFKDDEEKLCSRIRELLQIKDELSQEISEERKKESEMDSKIVEIERNILQTKRREKSRKAKPSNQRQSGRCDMKVKDLERRLEQATKRFGGLLQRNADLRAEISNLCLEKRKFEGLHKKMFYQLDTLRRESSDTIDNIRQAHDTREEAEMKMILLKEKYERETQMYQSESRDLRRTIHHNYKFREFMSLKAQERELLMSHGEGKRRQLEELDKANKQLTTLNEYQSGFQKAQAMVNEPDLDHLVHKFIEKEDEIFSLFKLVADKNSQIVAIQSSIDEMTERLNAFHEYEIQLDAERGEIKQAMDKKFEKVTTKANEIEKRNKELHKIIAQLQIAIDSIFRKADDEESAIFTLLGTAEGVTDDNMLQYLGAVEMRVNQLASALAFTRIKESKDPAAAAAEGIANCGPGPVPVRVVKIVPPSTESIDFSGDEEFHLDSSRPLTREELELLVMKSVSEREGSSRTKSSKSEPKPK